MLVLHRISTTLTPPPLVNTIYIFMYIHRVMSLHALCSCLHILYMITPPQSQRSSPEMTAKQTTMKGLSSGPLSSIPMRFPDVIYLILYGYSQRRVPHPSLAPPPHCRSTGQSALEQLSSYQAYKTPSHSVHISIAACARSPPPAPPKDFQPLSSPPPCSSVAALSHDTSNPLTTSSCQLLSSNILRLSPPFPTSKLCTLRPLLFISWWCVKQ